MQEFSQLLQDFERWTGPHHLVRSKVDGHLVPGTEVTTKRVPELVPEEIAKRSGMKLNWHPAWRPGNDHHLIPLSGDAEHQHSHRCQSSWSSAAWVERVFVSVYGRYCI